MTRHNYDIENAAYGELPHVNDVEVNEDVLMPAIYQIGELLFDFGLEEDFEVTLLHHHFNIQLDEIVVEFVDEASGQLRTICARQSDFIGRATPQSWRLMGDGQIVPMSYRVRDDASTSAKELPTRLLQKIRDVLERNSAENTLGIALRDFASDDDDTVLVEHTDEERRVQWFTKEPIDSSSNFLETAWSFKKLVGEDSVPGNLTVRVAAKCSRYCVTRPDGEHHSDHTRPRPSPRAQ
jgi:hypothetical protein